MTDVPTHDAAHPVPQTLIAADGASAVVHAHGAQVISWRPVGGVERLFLSRTADYRAQAAIRGGIPVIFPQFAGEGSLPKHGFARVSEWRFDGGTRAVDGAASASWTLCDDETTRTLWLHAFAAQLTVVVGGSTLAVTLAVHNAGATPMRFTAALHSYFAVEDIAEVTVLGLGGHRYRDTAAGGVERRQTERALRIVGEVDRIYFDVPESLRLQERHCRLQIEAAGFPDVVIWNPGEVRGAALTDLEADGYAHMLCIEAAVIGRPVQLAPGERWQGTQTLIA